MDNSNRSADEPKGDMIKTIVKLGLGSLRGRVRVDIEGNQYLSFRGIPYAKPPVGPLRFKLPVPIEPWNDVRDTLDETPPCSQYDPAADIKEGSDDCLYLDVATKSLTESRPVMVWIHGGAFKKSSNTHKKYGPDYLLRHNIVFVSINYRLGILGYLNMNHKECPGNQGLHDQILALKWVQQNINEFGGDPGNVTIFGESAGGASVHYLCMSKQAKGLFHKAIIQSGVATNPWGHIESNSDVGFKIAEVLDKKCSTPEEVIEHLRTVPALELVETYEKYNIMENITLILKLVPSIDAKSPDPIFSHSINEMEKMGIDVPVIIGYNSHEGILCFANSGPAFIKKNEENFDQIVGTILKIKDSQKCSQVAKIIRSFYFANNPIDNARINSLVQFYGDIFFVANILRLGEIQKAKETPTYLYKFSYRADFPTLKHRLKINLEGTCHGDELGCLFYAEARGERLQEGTRDRKCMERMTKMWTDFAKFGNPTPIKDNELITHIWSSVEKSKKHAFEINDELIPWVDLDAEKWNLWKFVLDNINEK